jgi:methionyl-tRNA synthetase
MKRRLITSALPYVNNVPHLGNLIQVLSADVFARFCRLRGYETLYVCGTDEYGTATETKALEEGISPRALCDRFHVLHKGIYDWFGISFDRFGRTSTPEQTEIVQDIFRHLDSAGLISEKTIEQLYCDTCGRFLADRYVNGVCPHCGYAEARGDQCEHCGKLLEPTELKEPRCATCKSPPRPKSTSHLYIELPKIRDRLEAWMKDASVRGFWANNAIQMTQAWIRDGLHERCITRDLKWGIPVPRPGFTDKVFYVWFDAPIGYVSITAGHTPDWKSWWMDPDNVELFQFIGKDNIPFHTVIFPSSLLGDGRKWTMLHHMSSTEYLNYEGGKFSKSKGVGVFGTDAQESGIPADAWRFYIYYNRPEKSDVNFSWSDFQEKVNGELIGNLGNLVNRTLTFVDRYYGGKIPEAQVDPELLSQAASMEKQIGDHLEAAELRDAFRAAFSLSSLANKAFQDGEPWKTRVSEPQKAARLIRGLCLVIRDLAIILHPYLPSSAQRLAAFFGQTIGKGGLSWASLGTDSGLGAISKPEVLFSRLEDDFISALKDRYSGNQKERAEREAAGDRKAPGKDPSAPSPAAKAAEPKPAAPKPEEPKVAPLAGLPLEERFEKLIDLRVAVITKVERHPKADKLYIETLDDGSGTERVIVSGLVPHYAEEELLGKHIILAANLKPAKLRGTESRGMLLAASMEKEGGGEIVEALEAPWAAPGTRVFLEGAQDSTPAPGEIDIDGFFSVPILAKGGAVCCGKARLRVDGKPLGTTKVADGEIG